MLVQPYRPGKGFISRSRDFDLINKCTATKMNIVRVNLNDLCPSISVCVANIRFFLSSRPQISEILNSFWDLRDHLGRLVDAASDRPLDVFDFLKCEYPQLVRDIIGALGTALQKGLTRNAAVRSSCEAINEFLIKLEQLKPLTHSSVAGYF